MRVDRSRYSQIVIPAKAGIQGMGVSFDKLRTNVLSVYLPLSSVYEELSVKTIVLSDHTGDMIAMQERQNNRGYHLEMARYESANAELEKRIEEEYESRMSAYRQELVDWNAMSWARKLADGISKWRVLFLLCIVVMAACAFAYIAMPGNWEVLLGIPATAGFIALFFPTRVPRQPSRERISMRWLEPARPERGESSDEEQVWQAGKRRRAQGCLAPGRSAGRRLDADLGLSRARRRGRPDSRRAARGLRHGDEVPQRNGVRERGLLETRQVRQLRQPRGVRSAHRGPQGALSQRAGEWRGEAS